MIEVTGAILAKDFNELREKLSRFAGITKIVQIDVCDGKFVPSISWPLDKSTAGKNDPYLEKILDEEEGLPFWDKLDFEFDLMTLNAISKFDFFVRLGAKKIIFHLEAEDENKLKEFLESMDPYLRDNIEIGLAINNSTDIEKLDKFINNIDFIQCMGIDRIGFQGEIFDKKVIPQIKEIKNKYPEVKISIDGGVNEKSAPLLIEAGVNKLVIGSVLLKSYDIAEKIKEFEDLSI